MSVHIVDIEMGVDHLRAGRRKEAEAVFREALAAAPMIPRPLHLLGMLCHDTGRHEEALELLKRAIAVRPAQADFHNNLGTVLARLNREAEAVPAFREAARLRPDYAAALGNLSTALMNTGQLGEAAAMGRRAVAARPDYVPGYTALSAAPCGGWAGWGKPSTCRKRRRRWTSITPSPITSWPSRWSSREGSPRPSRPTARPPGWPTMIRGFTATCCSPCTTIRRLRRPSCSPSTWHGPGGMPSRWSGRSSRTTTTARPDRRLRVGYISADFREHTLKLFMEAVLAGHDKAGFEIFCYSDVTRPDETTREFKAAADVWREVAGLSDADLAAMIRRDRIDILVELTGHMGNNRLLVYARKPAPVQVAYPGYPNTTGLKTIDYCLTDADRDPPGVSERFYTERLVRMPVTAQYYGPSREEPGGGAPAISAARAHDVLLPEQAGQDIAGHDANVGRDPLGGSELAADGDGRRRGAGGRGGSAGVRPQWHPLRSARPGPPAGPAAISLAVQPGRHRPGHVPLQRPYHHPRRSMDGRTRGDARRWDTRISRGAGAAHAPGHAGAGCAVAGGVHRRRRPAGEGRAEAASAAGRAAQTMAASPLTDANGSRGSWSRRIGGCGPDGLEGRCSKQTPPPKIGSLGPVLSADGTTWGFSGSSLASGNAKLNRFIRFENLADMGRWVGDVGRLLDELAASMPMTSAWPPDPHCSVPRPQRAAAGIFRVPGRCSAVSRSAWDFGAVVALIINRVYRTSGSSPAGAVKRDTRLHGLRDGAAERPTLSAVPTFLRRSGS